MHRATISVAIAEEDGAPTSYGKIANDPSAIRKLMVRLGGPDVRLRVAYEAGPTGYALYRQLATLSIECMVVAPSLIPVRAGDKVKTDRRDALKLARLLRDAQLACYPGDCSHPLAALGDRLADHADGSLAHLERIPALECTV
jgi:transposase